MTKFIFFAVMTGILGCCPGWTEEPRDLQSDTWVAIDEAGRILPAGGKSLPPRKEKRVGIFYFLWHGAHGYDHHRDPADANEGVIPPGPQDNASPHDLTQWQAEGADPANLGELRSFHHWGQSEYGYYLSDDEWVIRRHLRSLTDAGVDVLIFDATNGFTYRKTYLQILKVIEALRAQGEATPQVAFLTHFRAAAAVPKLRKELYDPGRYRDLWFRWKEKPLLMTSAEVASSQPELSDFFTVRKSWAWSDRDGWFGDGRHAWPWIDRYPQKFGWDTDPGKPEFISVSAAGHATLGEGRSYHRKRQPPREKQRPYEGEFFAEQWKHALKVDPAFLMVTGWNEWVAMYFQAKEGETMLGRPAEAGSPVFVDLYSTEYNRDVEPDNSVAGDNLYYQMVAGIRRFKGARPPPPASAETEISLCADPKDWEKVEPEFRDSAGDTGHRNHPGWGRIGAYTHTSGRNDIVAAKVARDRELVVFAATTAAPLSPPSDPGWMELFLNTDRDFSSGWFGFDLKLGAPTGLQEKDGATRFNRPILKYCEGQWVPTGKSAAGTTQGNLVEIAVPRPLLPEPLGFYFKWADHPAGDGHILDLEKGGDTAPNRRFLYHFQTARPSGN